MNDIQHDPKKNNFRAQEGAAERLFLCIVDLISYDSLRSAINGCDSVFHTASPITNDPEQMVEPAVKGAKFMVEAAADAGICRVMFSSSIGTVYMDPKRDPHAIVNESYWSDLDYCMETKEEDSCLPPIGLKTGLLCHCFWKIHVLILMVNKSGH